MPFETDTRLAATDTRLAADVGQMYGEYLASFISEHRQVRADLFRRGEQLEAHVYFPTELDVGTVTDHYITELRDYAREHGFGGRLRIIYS